MEFHAVTADDRVRALLAASDLPIDDLDDPGIRLIAAFEGEALAGVIGLQVAGAHGLLRSLAVDGRFRGRRLGGTLCGRVEDAARARSLAALWLLTTTARDYFGRRGFAVVARDEVAPPIRATAEFRSLCPASAIVMRRPLG